VSLVAVLTTAQHAWKDGTVILRRHWDSEDTRRRQSPELALVGKVGDEPCGPPFWVAELYMVSVFQTCRAKYVVERAFITGC
jgi:hypothetical protein